MVAHVLRLRLALLLGALRSPKRWRMIIGLIVFVAAIAAVLYVTMQLRDETFDVAHAVIVTSGSALLIGATFAPFFGGVQDQLDPRRFTVFGLAPTPLAFSLLLASLISVPSLALIVAAAGVTLVWIDHDVSAPIAVIAAVIGVVTTIVISRISMLLSRLWRTRHSRELTALYLLVAVVIVVPVLVFVMSLQWEGVAPPALTYAAAIAGYTPFGAVWAFPGLFAAGAPTAILVLIFAVVTLGLLVWAWVALVNRALSTIERPLAERERSGMGWFALLPSTPWGAVAARSLVYWLRDKRYVVNMAVIPFAAVIAPLPLVIAGVPFELVVLLPIPLMALFFGWVPHNDVAYDSTAVWMHIVSGVRGIADRLGRLVPIVIIAVPLLAIAMPVAAAFYDNWAILPALVGVAVNLFLAGLGLSSISSVIAPYAATRPGDSAFQQPQRTGSGFGAQAAVLIGALVLSVQTLLVGWQAATEDITQAETTLWLGIAWGVGTFVVGVTIGALLWDRRGSRIMEFAAAS